MLTASPITNQPVGKTFTVAIGILGVGAGLQLLLIGWAFVNRARNGVPPAQVIVAGSTQPTFARVEPAHPVGSNNGDVASNRIEEPPQVLATSTSPANAATPPRPTPVTAHPVSTDPANRFDEMVLQGKELRERGDTSAAIIKFREAATVDPKSPAPLGELALTYEKMGLADKAAENWKRVYEMGAGSGGLYFALAQKALQASQAIAIKDATVHPPSSSEPAPDVSAPIEGIAAGAMLGLLKVTAEDQPNDSSSAKRLLLHIPIKARPKFQVEVKDLVIHVLFYDNVDNQNIVPTSADVNSRWATPPADWRDTDTEELAVEYKLPKSEARAAKRENRKYYGYIVRIYYKQQLQAAAAEPDRLAQQYPPPPTLPKENEK
jgi:tetratricopeptide (TPR) repeat protein